MSYRADGSYDPRVRPSGSASGGPARAVSSPGSGQQSSYSGGMQHMNPYGGQQPGVSSRVADETYVESSGYGVAPDLFAPSRRGGRVLVWVLALGLAFGAGLAVGRATADDDASSSASWSISLG